EVAEQGDQEDEEPRAPDVRKRSVDERRLSVRLEPVREARLGAFDDGHLVPSRRRQAANRFDRAGQLDGARREGKEDGVAAAELERSDPAPAFEHDEDREARLESAVSDASDTEEALRRLGRAERRELGRLESGVDRERLRAVEAEVAPLEQHREVGRLLE